MLPFRASPSAQNSDMRCLKIYRYSEKPFPLATLAGNVSVFSSNNHFVRFPKCITWVNGHISSDRSQVV